MSRGRRREPRQERSRALVSAIVEAATLLLEDEENASLSMKAIARRAGVGIGSVYEYFTDRDGIVDAIVDRLADINFKRLQRVLDESPSDDVHVVFTALIDETIAVYLDTPRLTRFGLKTAMRFDRMDFVIRERDRFTVLIAERLCTAYPGVDPEEAAKSALSATEMLSGVIMGELYRPVDPARRASMRSAMLRFIKTEQAYLASQRAAAPVVPEEAADASASDETEADA